MQRQKRESHAIYKCIATVVQFYTARGQEGFREDERPHNAELRKKSPFQNAGVRKSSAHDRRWKALRVSRKSAHLETTKVNLVPADPQKSRSVLTEPKRGGCTISTHVWSIKIIHKTRCLASCARFALQPLAGLMQSHNSDQKMRPEIETTHQQIPSICAKANPAV